jgi:hypothetical protein
LANERITVRGDSGIVAFILGALVVWLFFKFYKGSGSAAQQTAQQMASVAGQSASCGASGAIEDVIPTNGTVPNQDSDTGRFIDGISPEYN